MTERIKALLDEAEARQREMLNEIFGDRDEQWRRVSALAGLDEDGNILPPAAGVTISKEPVMWKTRYGVK